MAAHASDGGALACRKRRANAQDFHKVASTPEGAMIAQQVVKLPGSRRRMAVRRFLSDDSPEGRGLAYRTWRFEVTAR